MMATTQLPTKTSVRISVVPATEGDHEEECCSCCGSTVLIGRLLVDTTAFTKFSPCKWTEEHRRYVEDLAETAAHKNAVETKTGEFVPVVMSVAPTTWFLSEAETHGYYASFYPDAFLLPEVLHATREYGVVAGIFVDLCKGDQVDHPFVERELKWAALGRKNDVTAALPTAVLDGNGKDLVPWSAGLNGPGDFVGLFVRDDVVEVSDGRNCKTGLLVVRVGNFDRSTPTLAAEILKANRSAATKKRSCPSCCPEDCTASCCPEDCAAPQTLKDALFDKLHTYRAFACHPAVLAARNLALRNARRILHDAAVALGFEKETSELSVPDVAALSSAEDKEPSNIALPAPHSRRSVIDALTDTPFLAVEDVFCELDFMEAEEGTGGADVVSYYDSVVSVKTAKGGLVSLEQGEPEKGVRLTNITDYKNAWKGVFQRSFDGGFIPKSIHSEWNTPAWVKDHSPLYSPLCVVKKQ